MRSPLLLGTAALLVLAAPVPASPPPAAPTHRHAAAATRTAGGADASRAPAGRNFLAFDPAGDGTAVEVLGDLATADRIAVLVPGVDTRLADFDRGLGGVARRAPAVQARALHRELIAADPAAKVAVVAWLGYDTPDGIGLDAVREGRVAASGLRADLTSVLPLLSAP